AQEVRVVEHDRDDVLDLAFGRVELAAGCPRGRSGPGRPRAEDQRGGSEGGRYGQGDGAGRGACDVPGRLAVHGAVLLVVEGFRRRAAAAGASGSVWTPRMPRARPGLATLHGQRYALVNGL